MEENVKLLKMQPQVIKENASRQDEEKARLLAKALDASVIAKRECAELKSLLEEEKRLVRRLVPEKDDELQLAKRQIEEIDQELARAQKDAELARKDADAAENEWIKVKREVKEKEELIKLLKLEIQEMRQITERQVEEVNQELEEARNDADIAQNEWIKVKREVKEKEELIKILRLEIQEMRQTTERLVEEVSQELKARDEVERAQNDAEIDQLCVLRGEWTKVKREVKKKDDLIKLLKLEIREMRQFPMRQAEELSKKLDDAGKAAELAQNDADIAQNEWMKAKKDLQEKLELIQMLKLQCQETSERAMRQVEEKELELADALNAVTSASSSSSVAQDCVICLTNEKDMAFGCGHMTCEECGTMLSTCPICRKDITNRIKLFPG